jgi:DNA repair exonuclease SbcCD ATPase subunit
MFERITRDHRRTANLQERDRCQKMIRKLKSIKDRITDAFSSAINNLEPDLNGPPSPRNDQLEKIREELEEVFDELGKSQEELRKEIDRMRDEDPHQ